MRHALIALIALTACTGKDDAPLPDAPPSATDLPSPFLPGEVLLPFPSDQYVVDDERTVTKRRVEVAASLYPPALAGDLLGGMDGFSRVSPIVTWLPGGIDPTSLPDPTDWGATTRADASVLLVREDTFELVPALVEVDQTDPVAESRVLVVRPHRTLDPGARYAVIVTTKVKALDGTAHAADDATRALLAGEDSDDRATASWRDKYELVRDALAALELSDSDVAQAWTFSVRSQEQVIHTAIALQDLAMTADVSDYTLEEPVVEGGQTLFHGTVKLPWYLDADDRLVLDDAGEPVAQGTRDVPFLVAIPDTVTAPRPLVMFGHGFFSSLEESTWGLAAGGLAQWQMTAVSTTFYGFSMDDGSAVSTPVKLTTNLRDTDTVVHQQLVSHAHFTAIQRLVIEHLADEITLGEGEDAFHPLDATQIHYTGASNGGTQGLVMLTTSPLLTRGALVVPGGGWTHMLQRASQWSTLGGAVAAQFATTHELQVAMSVLQNVLDPVDSLNYVDRLLQDRLEGRPADPEILLVEAVNDAQVSNLVTAWCAGNAGIPEVVPSARPIWGVDTVEAPVTGGLDIPAAVSVYDLGVPDVPVGNIPPTENGVHDGVRDLPTYKDQLDVFLNTGNIVNPCDGPCVSGD